MINKVLGIVTLSALTLTSACATSANKSKSCDGFDTNCAAVSQADAEDVTGFVPLISPALGALAAAAGVAAASSGGSNTTSTTSTIE